MLQDSRNTVYYDAESESIAWLKADNEISVIDCKSTKEKEELSYFAKDGTILADLALCNKGSGLISLTYNKDKNNAYFNYFNVNSEKLMYSLEFGSKNQSGSLASLKSLPKSLNLLNEVSSLHSIDLLTLKRDTLGLVAIFDKQVGVFKIQEGFPLQCLVSLDFSISFLKTLSKNLVLVAGGSDTAILHVSDDLTKLDVLEVIPKASLSNITAVGVQDGHKIVLAGSKGDVSLMTITLQ